MGSLNNLPTYFGIIEHLINKYDKADIDDGIKRVLEQGTAARIEDSEARQQREQLPIMLVGCKKDLIDKNRAQYILINTKVMQALKKLDADSLVQYVETGVSSTSQGF